MIETFEEMHEEYKHIPKTEYRKIYTYSESLFLMLGLSLIWLHSVWVVVFGIQIVLFFMVMISKILEIKNTKKQLTPYQKSQVYGEVASFVFLLGILFIELFIFL